MFEYKAILWQWNNIKYNWEQIGQVKAVSDSTTVLMEGLTLGESLQQLSRRLTRSAGVLGGAPQCNSPDSAAPMTYKTGKEEFNYSSLIFFLIIELLSVSRCRREDPSITYFPTI